MAVKKKSVQVELTTELLKNLGWVVQRYWSNPNINESRWAPVAVFGSRLDAGAFMAKARKDINLRCVEVEGIYIQPMVPAFVKEIRKDHNICKDV